MSVCVCVCVSGWVGVCECVCMSWNIKEISEAKCNSRKKVKIVTRFIEPVMSSQLCYDVIPYIFFEKSCFQCLMFI